MTITVTVRTRAVGAVVTNGNEETKVPARSERDFTIDGTGQLSFKENDPVEETPPAQKPATEKPAPATEVSDADADEVSEQSRFGKSSKKSKD